MSEPLYPLFLRLGGRLVLVVGGGVVAERKVGDLLAAGARVQVVAPEVTAGLAELAQRGEVALERRPFEAGDVEGAWLVIAATDAPDAQAAAREAADRARVFVVAVDDPANATAYGGAVLRREGMTVAISTAGAAPALARLLREVLEQALPEGDWVARATELRERWKREGTPMASRFGELVRAFKEESE